MVSRGADNEPKITMFKDHQVITPDTRKLRRTVRAAMPGEPDQVEAAEQALAGQGAQPDRVEAAADAVLQGAQGQGHNDFKIPLARRVLAGVLAEAAA